MLPGKLPADTLARLLAQVPHRDPRVLIGPGIGRDAAVIDNGGPKLLVAKADPVTFATDQIGRYAVHVNANDIACMGAAPAWFLATVFLPDGAEPSLAETIFQQITDACAELGVELVGGHTEVTYRLDRPIVSGAMLGEVERDRLVRAENARPGDAVIMTRGIAIEGTAVLAREAPEALAGAGVSAKDIKRAQRLIADPGISVVREALAACNAVRVHAMHDPTEGGLATALHELAEACGTGLQVDAEAIAVLPLTRTICDALGLDPLGLLASGALLLAVADPDCEAALKAVRDTGSPASRIGSLLPAKDGVIMRANEQSKPVPRFARDEVARFLSQQG
jgi:hydrogenase expression/formation protein HypE